MPLVETGDIVVISSVANLSNTEEDLKRRRRRLPKSDENRIFTLSEKLVHQENLTLEDQPIW